MFKNQKILVLVTALLSSFYSINASLIDKDSISVVDLNVYDGHGSILLTWSLPDSITSNHIYLFSRGIDDLDFDLIYESNVDEKRFLDFCFERGLHALKGHRSVGGFRASIYNAMPEKGVEALISAMRDFEKQS